MRSNLHYRTKEAEAHPSGISVYRMETGWVLNGRAVCYPWPAPPQALHNKLQNELNQHTLRPGDLLRRYCSSLGLANEVRPAPAHSG